jgi:hypothetical protein
LTISIIDYRTALPEAEKPYQVMEFFSPLNQKNAFKEVSNEFGSLSHIVIGRAMLFMLKAS